jgi:DNA-binding transcriptional LysR family regulator
VSALTVKQLQTFFWAARLGTVGRAADRLNITQSAATKRLQELEALASTSLFEGDNGRKNRLTPKGRELLADCERLLALLDEMDSLKRATEQPARTLHVGLTELTALNWLPLFLKRMKSLYPTIAIQPEIDLSTFLRRKVQEGRLDFAILPDPPAVEDLARVRLGEAQFAWFAPPGLFRPGTTYTLQDLAAYTVIEQTENSIITSLCARLWESAGVNPERVYGGNNVVTLAALISAGIGISCLPVALFARELEQGRMATVETSPPAPTVDYFCCFLQHPNSALGYAVADIARQCWASVSA